MGLVGWWFMSRVWWWELMFEWCFKRVCLMERSVVSVDFIKLVVMKEVGSVYLICNLFFVGIFFVLLLLFFYGE